jgi:hypothetical protein
MASNTGDFSRSKITDVDIQIYHAVYAYVEKHQGLFPTAREIEAATGRSTSVIDRSIAKLVTFGYVERVAIATPGTARPYRLVGAIFMMPPLVPMKPGWNQATAEFAAKTFFGSKSSFEKM